MYPASLLSFLLSYIVPILALFLLSVLRNTRKTVNGLNLPPGTMGFPLIGETIQFAKSHPSTAIGKFVAERVQKYGKIFKTHLIGNPTVITLDREFITYILKNEGTLFEHDFPIIATILFGDDYDELLRNKKQMNLTHQFLSTTHVRSHFLQDFELITLEVLRSWNKGVVFPFRDEVEKVTFFFMMKSMFSLNSEEDTTKKLFKLFKTLSKEGRSIPLNIPGTSFRNAWKTRCEILETLQHLIEERSIFRNKDNINIIDDNSEFLSKLLGTPNVNMDILGTQLFSLLMAGFEPITVALCLTIYFLGTCPRAMKELREEHGKIHYNKKMKREQNLTWEDIREMQFTQHVITETLRLGNIVYFMPKKTVADVKFKGYDIPRGWKVMLFFPGMHLDAEVYKEPECFDPWRWKDEDKINEMMDSYMPFSRGPHMCTGRELVRMEISVFLHHLVTMYDWESLEIEPPQMIYGIVGFAKNLPIKVYPRV